MIDKFLNLLPAVGLGILIIVIGVGVLFLFMEMWNSKYKVFRVISRVIAAVLISAIILFILHEYFDTVVIYLAFIGLIFLWGFIFKDNTKE